MITNCDNFFLCFITNQFKVDRLQIILVAKNIYIYASQLFISRMPKMRAIPQLVSAPLHYITLHYYIATRITKRDDYTACNSTRVPPPSLPSLEFKGMPWLHAKPEELLIQVCMRIFSLNYLSELRNYSLVLQPQPTSKDKKGRSPMNALKLISIMKSMLLKTKLTHLSPARWYRSLTGIRRWELKNCLI